MDNNNPTLPEIRQDLEIIEGGMAVTGGRYWLVQDRIKNSYYRLSEQFMKLLRIWEPVSCEQLLQKANAMPGYKFSREDISDLTEFLYANALTTTPPTAGYNTYCGQSEAGKKSWWLALIHNYLFFKIPITRPQKFLDLSWPYIAFLFTRRSAVVFFLLAIIGLYLVSRQWSTFLTTFSEFLSLEGFILYAFSLVAVKSLHELGHAFMAKKYEVEVPTIGVAFIVMMPILYTNTTAAWRLQNRNQRLMIDAAGIFTELAIAAICTILWIFLPDGNLRAIAFTTATLSWALSLTINLNPFMKFDGYYILSDYLEFENLQDRGFALARWWLREKLFAISRPPPEYIERNLQTFIILHAFGVWIYRFFLFLGIALLVYHFFFKLLGIFMFVIELIWFIGMPVWREIKQWWQLRSEILNARRYKKTLLIVLMGLLVLAWPWSKSVSFPAIMAQINESESHPALPSRVEKIFFSQGMHVKQGQLLVQLNSPDLDQEIAYTMIEQQTIRDRLARAHADSQDRSWLQVLEKRSQSISSKLNGLYQKLDKLEIRAPHTGRIVDIALDLHPGRWVNENLRLAMVATTNTVEIKALINAKSRRRIELNAQGHFIPDDLRIRKLPVTLIAMSDVAGAGAELSYLTEKSGSKIPLIPGSEKTRVPKGAWYSLRLAPIGLEDRPDSVIRGVVVLEAERESLLLQILRQIASVLIRESGF